jgi:hypothetical protein
VSRTTNIGDTSARGLLFGDGNPGRARFQVGKPRGQRIEQRRQFRDARLVFAGGGAQREQPLLRALQPVRVLLRIGREPRQQGLRLGERLLRALQRRKCGRCRVLGFGGAGREQLLERPARRPERSGRAVCAAVARREFG